MRVFKLPSAEFEAVIKVNAGRVHAVAAAEDTLLVGAANSVRLYRASTRQLLARLEGHTGLVSCAAIYVPDLSDSPLATAASTPAKDAPSRPALPAAGSVTASSGGLSRGHRVAGGVQSMRLRSSTRMSDGVASIRALRSQVVTTKWRDAAKRVTAAHVLARCAIGFGFRCCCLVCFFFFCFRKSPLQRLLATEC